MTRKAVSAGIRTIQLRDKNMSKNDLYKQAVSMREITLKHKVTFIVNDYIDIALAVGADGVHLGQEDMPLHEARKLMGKKKIIGISTHNLRQAVYAEEAGADYIGFGPMFHTSTKDAGSPRGLRQLKNISNQVHIPIIAIGGITCENIREVLNAGADKAAVASGILAGDIKENTEKFYSNLRVKSNDKNIIDRP
jgi:thiamine-phosphate pyrophosphorylase